MPAAKSHQLPFTPRLIPRQPVVREETLSRGTDGCRTASTQVPDASRHFLYALGCICLIVGWLIVLPAPLAECESGTPWPPNWQMESSGSNPNGDIAEAAVAEEKTGYVAANGDAVRNQSAAGHAVLSDGPVAEKPFGEGYGGEQAGIVLPGQPSNWAGAPPATPTDASPSATTGTAQSSSLQHPASAAATDKNGQPGIPLHRGGERTATPSSAGPAKGKTAPWVATLGALATVLGVFLVFMWGMKRFQPSSSQVLPSGVIEVLGQAPLSGRQRLCLIRLGRKLVLIATGPDGTEPLSEIEDPAEVDRLVGLCATARGGSSTQVFRQIFGRYMNGADGGANDHLG